MPAELLNQRSQWQDIAVIKRALLPAHVSEALYDQGSLTQRIKKLCVVQNQPFAVDVINESEQKPMINEQRYLRMRDGLFARVREIYLLCGQTQMIYARSVIPHSTLTGRQRQIKHLKNKSLGAYLFSDRTLKREITQIARAQLYGKTVWGRRSVFDVDNKPLIVAEWFLENVNLKSGS